MVFNLLKINTFFYFLVSCNTANDNFEHTWTFNHGKLESHREYLKSNDIIYLSIYMKEEHQFKFLHGHDIQFTIGNDTFQEVFCHHEELERNNEVSELILFSLFKY